MFTVFTYIFYIVILYLGYLDLLCHGILTFGHILSTVGKLISSLAS